MKIAKGLHRIGSDIVNSYLVVDGGGVTIIDAGLPRYWKLLNSEMIYLPLHHQVIVWAMSNKLDMPIVPNDTPQFRWAKFKQPS